jgi:outer membrane usher protein
MNLRGGGRLLACALLLAGAARAEPSASAAAAASDGRAQLDLLVNEAPFETVLVLLRDGDAFVAREDLERAGVDASRGRRVQIDGRDYVSLQSLAPDIRFRVDEQALALRLTVPTSQLPGSVVDLRPSARPQGLELHRDTSAFANYSVQTDMTGGVAAFLETGASWQGALLYNGASRTTDGNIVRGLTNLTYDEPESLRRWVGGDAVAGGTVLGGSAVLAGVSISRQFGLDPYLIRGPLPKVQGFALTPSQVDVYVNGVLVRQESVKAGQFDLLNLPIESGDGSYRAVVRDAFGREQEVNGRYYFSSGLLRPGLTDYSYQAGFVRNGFGSTSWDYGAPGFVARHRFGIANWFTAGAEVEGTRGAVAGGPSFTVGLPFGELELTGAASGGRGGLGGAASLGYTYTSRQFSVGGLVRALSESYANLSLRPQDDRALLQANVFAGMPIAGRFSVNAELQTQHYRDAGQVGRLGLRGDAQILQGTMLSLSVGRTEGGGSAGLDAYVSLIHFFGDQTTASASTGTSGSNATAQRTVPTAGGFGYRVTGDTTSGTSTVDALAQYQGQYGLYQAEYRRTGNLNGGMLQAAGGVVAMGGGLFFTRPVSDGYALIQVPGVADVRGFLNNQEIGHTDSKGNLLIPGLASYYGNKISIDGTDLPIDYELGSTDRLVATSLRGGARVLFDAKRVQAVTGEVEAEGGVIPAYGELAVALDGRNLASPVGSDGRFWLEGLPAGHHSARLEFGGGECQVDLDVPVSVERAIDLGRVHCASPSGRVAAR